MATLSAAGETHSATQRAFRLPPLAAAGTLVALAAVALLSATTGAAGLAFGDVLAALVDRLPLVDVDSSLSARQEGILFQIRLPRLVLGMFVGGSLALAGAAYQGVFRNPLADPYLLGVSAGAGFGAVLALGFGLDVGWGPFDALPAAAFLGALVAVTASAAIARGACSRRRPCCSAASPWRRSSRRRRPTPSANSARHAPARCCRGCSASSAPAVGGRS